MRLSITLGSGFNGKAFGGAQRTSAQNIAAMQETGRYLAKQFSGYTVTQSAGGWIQDGELISEKGLIYLVDGEDTDIHNRYRSVANMLRTIWQQDSVVVNLIPSTVVFVDNVREELSV